MEYVGAISEVEWNSFTEIFSDEANFMAQLLGKSSLNNDVSSTCWPVNVNISGVDESSIYSLDETNTGVSSVLFPSLSPESCYMNVPHQIFVTNNNLMGMDYYVMENKNNNSLVHKFTNNVMVGADDFFNQDVSNDSIDFSEDLASENFPRGETLKEDRIRSPCEIFRKRPRIPAGEFQKSKKKMKPRKFLKVDEDEALYGWKRSSTLCSEDDSNASHELCGVTSSSNGVPKSNGKTRASKGSATDPQSLYARKRRERINARLRILQNLVPNGTKVDISTMLEEAVQYVKFLQLQIKLLSSDDHWMYAPLAYNGMDIGLDLKISAQK